MKKLSVYFKGIAGGVFSFALLKAIAASFAYYIYEQVLWRKKINLLGKARIHATASIRNAHNVYVGNNAHINHHCCIWCDQNSRIVLGENLLMGPGVKMFTSNHGMEMGKPMTFQERKEADIIIGGDVWIGANSVILAGVQIGEGTVIAAGSVVTKNIPPYVVAGGVPAKVIRQRDWKQ